MTSRDAGTEVALRCTHCGRPVRDTLHTRTSYRVDYYALHSGHGERHTVGGDERGYANTYVRLLDRFDVITCTDCYGRAVIQAERDRQFRPERTDTNAGDP